MKTISASYVVTCDENNRIIKDDAVIFDDKIVEINTLSEIKNKYPNLEIKKLEESSILMPGLVNSHIHLEFSINTTTLRHGNFYSWLNSAIKHREDLINKATNELVSTKLNKIKKTGTTTIGAISSCSFDIEACIKSPVNTVLFREVIGLKADVVDTLFADFRSRLSNARKFASKNFIPTIVIHSPYSVHPFLVRGVLNVARDENLVVSSHFLESQEEFEWLHKDEGSSLEFFKDFLNQEKATSKPMEFLGSFSKVKNLSSTYCAEASDDDLEKIKDLDASINRCVTSSRFLNNTKLGLDRLRDIPFTIGTDGLSSNSSLFMFGELRNALMAHYDKNVVEFSKTLLEAATFNGSRALGLNKGALKESFDADMISFELPNKIEDINDICMQIILHTKFIDDVIIGGEYI